MGEIITFLGCYFLIDRLKPICIEIMELIFTIIEIILLIWGIVDIPWKDIRIGAKIFYIIMLIFIAITLIINLILIYLTCSNKVNTTHNNFGIYLCISTIALTALTKIFLFIAEVIIVYDMYYKDNDDDNEDKKFSSKELAAVIITFIVTELVLSFHCFCSSLLLKLLYAKTDLSYSNYIHQKNQNFSSSTVKNNINEYTLSNQQFNTDNQSFSNNYTATAVPIQNNYGEKLFQ